MCAQVVNTMKCKIIKCWGAVSTLQLLSLYFSWVLSLLFPCVPYFWDEKLTWNVFLKLSEILCEAILKQNKKYYFCTEFWEEKNRIRLK